MEETTGKANNKSEPKFSKAQWLKAKKFLATPDLVMVSLEKDTLYTEKEVEKAIQAFIKGGN